MRKNKIPATFAFIDAASFAVVIPTDSTIVDEWRDLLHFVSGKIPRLRFAPLGMTGCAKLVDHIDFGSLRYLLEYKKEGDPKLESSLSVMKKLYHIKNKMSRP